MNIKTIAFEGICCAGKSSCIAQIKRTLPIYSLQEYSDYEYTIPNFPHVSEELIWQTMYTFSDVEKKRFKQWSEIKTNSSSSIILMDRSFVTILAFQYAAISYGFIDMMDRLEEYWLGYSQVIVPDKIIIFDVAYKEQLNRARAARENYLPILLDENFNLRFIDYTKKFCKKIGVPSVYINTTGLSLDQIRELTYNHL